MNSRIENGLNGKYLYIASDNDEGGFEYKMAASVVSESLIAPTKVFAHGEICLEYCITGLKLFEEYLSSIRGLRRADIVRLLAQTEQCVRTVENYLLRAGDLLINPQYLYADETTGSLRICVVPDYEGNFEAEFKQFITKLLMHIDEDDEATLKLGHKLFKAISATDYKLQDVMAVLKNDSTGRRAPDRTAVFVSQQGISADNQDQSIDTVDDINCGENYNESTTADICGYAGQTSSNAEQTRRYTEEDYYTEDKLSRSYGTQMQQEQTGTQSGYDYVSEEASDNTGGRGVLKETLTGLAVSQAILIGVAVAVFLLKGRATVMRLAPIYIIIAVCVTVYYLISLFMKRQK